MAGEALEARFEGADRAGFEDTGEGIGVPVVCGQTLTRPNSKRNEVIIGFVILHYVT